MFTVGISGGSGAGKTLLAMKLMDHFGPRRAVLVSQDCYYRGHSHLPPERRQEGNFDEPAAVELSLLIQHLDDLRAGKTIRRPRYVFSTHTRVGADPVAPRELVLIDGLFVLTDDRLRERMDLGVFVDAPEEERIRRRIQRDVEERGRTEAEVIERLRATVLPMHALHVEPGKGRANLIVNGCGDPAPEATRVIAEIEKRLAK